MRVQIALLRAVNVGGTGKLPKADFRALAASIGMKHVRSLFQSGNLIFDGGSKTPTASEKLLESACASTFGLTTEIYVRVPAELEQIIARNPIAKEARDDPGHLVVLFMRTAPDTKSLIALQASIAGGANVCAVIAVTRTSPTLTGSDVRDSPAQKLNAALAGPEPDAIGTRS